MSCQSEPPQISPTPQTPCPLTIPRSSAKIKFPITKEIFLKICP